VFVDLLSSRNLGKSVSVGLGRWLGRRWGAAETYSRIGTTRLHELDPEVYRRHVFELIASLSMNRVHELLP
jgi:hypothetical protein